MVFECERETRSLCFEITLLVSLSSLSLTQGAHTHTHPQRFAGPGDCVCLWAPRARGQKERKRKWREKGRMEVFFYRSCGSWVGLEPRLTHTLSRPSSRCFLSLQVSLAIQVYPCACARARPTTGHRVGRWRHLVIFLSSSARVKARAGDGRPRRRARSRRAPQDALNLRLRDAHGGG